MTVRVHAPKLGRCYRVDKVKRVLKRRRPATGRFPASGLIPGHCPDAEPAPVLRTRLKRLAPRGFHPRPQAQAHLVEPAPAIARHRAQPRRPPALRGRKGDADAPPALRRRGPCSPLRTAPPPPPYCGRREKDRRTRAPH